MLPSLADDLCGCEAFEGLAPSGVGVGINAQIKVSARLIVVVLEVPFDGSLRGGAVPLPGRRLPANAEKRAFGLTIRPRGLGLVGRCPTSFALQIMSKRCTQSLAVQPFPSRGWSANRTPAAIVSRTNGVPMARSVRMMLIL